MLQYFAVGLCTCSPHPTRAQIRRGMMARSDCLDTPASDSTGGVYVAALTPCQPSRRVVHACAHDAFDTREPVHNVDNRARCCAVRHMPVRNLRTQ